MNLPRSLKVRPLNPSSSPISKQILHFNIQKQEQSNWCWAAVAVSVNHYYNPGSSWNQCQLVNELFVEVNCCDNGASLTCNRPFYTDIGLRKLGNLLKWGLGKATLAEVKNQINANRLLSIGISWNGGGGHAIVCNGCYTVTPGESQYIAIADPIYGISGSLYDNFPKNYHGGAGWTSTYWTKPE